MDDLIKKILSKETLLLALLTGSSYFFAYLFEFGYSQYFNYPHEFISIKLVLSYQEIQLIALMIVLLILSALEKLKLRP